MTITLPDEKVQTVTGLTLAIMVIGAWAMLHIGGVFFYPLSSKTALFAIPLVALQCWLNVGLFIIAHDAMHGSLAPHRPNINRWMGRIVLALYAGFSYDKLIIKHHEHHRYAGTDKDPDFDHAHPDKFWPWYYRFFKTYFGVREFAILTFMLVLYIVGFGASPLQTLLFWGLPAILSSFQLFYFGTWLPHRHDERGFADHHHARTNDFGWWMSLLTCFHFGYHHEHHLSPRVPWWYLPKVRLSK